MTTADPINANARDGVFIMTAGLTRRRPIIKPKFQSQSEKAQAAGQANCTHGLRSRRQQLRAYLDVEAREMRLIAG